MKVIHLLLILLSSVALNVTFGTSYSVYGIDCGNTSCIEAGVNSTDEPACVDDKTGESVDCSEYSNGELMPGISKKSDTTLGEKIGDVVRVMLFGVGAISVIMIIYSGILYVISAGSSEKIKKAKDTIKYSIVGLVISILAYAIVNFVIGSLK